jgi:hypothetical protein
MGAREEIYDLEDFDIGEFYVGIALSHRRTNIRWELIIVYGPAPHERSSKNCTELSGKCMVVVLPMVLGGDFIVIISVKDKNNSNINQDLMDKFNMCNDLLQL